MKTALIIGSEGQDGRLLNEYLRNFNYNIFEIGKTTIKVNGEISSDKFLIKNEDLIKNFIKVNKPDEIYYLAGYHHSSEDFQLDSYEEFLNSYNINVKYYYNILDSVRLHSLNTKIFYSSSSHIFGNASNSPQDESTPMNPTTIYGIHKLAATNISKVFRRKYNIFASVGILYTHESKYRKINFLSRKIVTTAIKIKNNNESKLIIGNPDSLIDWGYAKDYVVAMKKILDYKVSTDFIISSGRLHKLSDFINYVFSYLNLDYKKYIVVDEIILNRKSIYNLYGNPNKIKSKINWNSSISLKALAEKLVDAELLNIS